MQPGEQQVLRALTLAGNDPAAGLATGTLAVLSDMTHSELVPVLRELQSRGWVQLTPHRTTTAVRLTEAGQSAASGAANPLSPRAS